MKTISRIILVGLFIAIILLFNCEKKNPDILVSIQKISDVQKDIKHLHPFLEKLFPVALVKNDSFYVYDIDSLRQTYSMVTQAPVPFPVPEGIQASFPLECYHNKPACVISEKLFENEAGYPIIFHEFMHCYQMILCEQKLKNSLQVYREAMANQNYMWELNYPFPYEDQQFSLLYNDFSQALNNDDTKLVIEIRRELKRSLNDQDYEYMVWQEWKEGFARLIENKIRIELGFNENKYGADRPFHRVSFYAVGSAYIDHLAVQHPEFITDIEKLFYAIKDPE